MMNLHHRVVLFLPFVPADLREERIEIVSREDLPPIMLGSTELAGTFSKSDIDARPLGTWWEQFFFTVQADTVTVGPNGTASVAAQLVMNETHEPIPRAVELQIESAAGYLPRRRVQFDENGRASFDVCALGLQAGDNIAVKFSTPTFSSVGVACVEVE